MDTPHPPRLGLGLFWPDDYTDFLVHFHEPFDVFRLELDRDPDEPLIFWVAPDSPFETMAEEAFENMARAARKYLGTEELIELGTTRRVELRITEVPFPPMLMVSNRQEEFFAILGLGAEPFTAYIGNDTSGPLITDIELGFESESPMIATELSDYCEAYYHEFYDRQDVLEKKNKEKRHGPRRASDHGFSRN